MTRTWSNILLIGLALATVSSVQAKTLYQCNDLQGQSVLIATPCPTSAALGQLDWHSIGNTTTIDPDPGPVPLLKNGESIDRISIKTIAADIDTLKTSFTYTDAYRGQLVTWENGTANASCAVFQDVGYHINGQYRSHPGPMIARKNARLQRDSQPVYLKIPEGVRDQVKSSLTVSCRVKILDRIFEASDRFSFQSPGHTGISLRDQGIIALSK